MSNVSCTRKRISIQLTGLATALIALLSPTLGYSQQAGPSMCYVPGSGTVYLIKAEKTPSTCRSGHATLQLTAPTSAGPQLGPNNNSLPTNAQGAFDFANDNGFVAAGTFGTGNIPATGGGTRLMWYPRKFALRAGFVGGNGSPWDDANIGAGSVGFGLGGIASGIHSFTAGTSNTASGQSAVAMGYTSYAKGDFSIAMGWGANASGQDAVALGRESWASDGGAVALGKGAKAQKWDDVAIGRWSIANGGYATAIGAGNALGNQSVAIGGGAKATGISSMAIGGWVTASGDGSTALGHHVNTDGKKGAFMIGDMSTGDWTYASADNQFVVRAQRIWLGKTTGYAAATAGRYIETSTGAYLSTGGAWVSSSDSTKKHRWQDVDGEDVLSRLAAMPVRSWSYREEGDSVRHVGPTAQDFRNAFGLGDTDKAIASVDADGVSLAGIKALVQRTADLRRENEELRTALGDVLRRLAELEAARR